MPETELEAKVLSPLEGVGSGAQSVVLLRERGRADGKGLSPFIANKHIREWINSSRPRLSVEGEFYSSLWVTVTDRTDVLPSPPQRNGRVFLHVQ